jgi:hypothetical protein
MKISFVGLLMIALPSVAIAGSPHWITPPQQGTYKQFKKFWTSFSIERGTYSFHSAYNTSDGGGLKYTRLWLIQPFDGDDTNCCYGTYVDSKGETLPAICVLSQMGKNGVRNRRPGEVRQRCVNYG